MSQTEELSRREEQFLENVLENLRQRIGKIAQELEEGQKDIESMHEYYWENYTEMDQYGYEDYDNQQALLHRINANQEKLDLKHRFQKMLDSPFFGRVDFIYEGEEEAEPFYIGIGNFAQRTGATPLIYDWRAPVSSLFYDYDSGPASYEAPAGVLTGEIAFKWQYKIKNGKMIYAFESDTKIDDEILKQELGSSGDVQLKNIVRTIQKEQNEIIRNTGDKILVIQGAAGSGKTSVALHRIAYLLYHDREHLKSSNILILSPNSVFSDYISHILPELGEENIREMSFDLFAYKELKDVVSDCEDRYHHMERQMKFPDKKRQKRFRDKQSFAMTGQMESFLAVLEDRLLDLTSVEFKGMQLREEELIELCYFKFQEIPLLARMDAVKEYFKDQYETLHNRDLSEEEEEILQRKFDRMYVTKDLYVIYNWLMEECGYEKLPDVPYERRILEYEDVFPMLYLKYRLKGKNEHRNIKHLVIDEMQDYSYLQYVILHTLFSCRMTILGDKAQTLDETMQDVLLFLPKIFGKKMRTIVLNKSYRNTVEIATYAGALNRNIKHLVIDEMQDYSYLQYVILHTLFSCRMTILGDKAQTLDETMQDVLLFLPKIFGKKMRTIVLNKSYRNTVEIATYAGALNPTMDLELLDRHGKAVEEVHFSEEESMLKAIGENLNVGENGYETAAVIAMTEEKARELYELLKRRGIQASYIDRDTSVFERGLTVTTFYLAKGLEFDQVFGVFEEEENPLMTQAKYICATRALHELYMYTVSL